MQIPRAILSYAEVVVDSEGVAHRPYFQRIQAGENVSQKWQDGRMTDVAEPRYTFSYVPDCRRDDAPGRCLSAGWADRQGHAGCEVCWPEGTV
jgi:hypothetical protein